MKCIVLISFPISFQLLLAWRVLQLLNAQVFWAILSVHYQNVHVQADIQGLLVQVKLKTNCDCP